MSDLEFYKNGFENRKRTCIYCGEKFCTGTRITGTLDGSDPEYPFVERKSCGWCKELED
ncbi:MAG: hypothetical protein KQA40_00275 [Candidatus Aenigmarchaeota archaeon]|nr:hypothetical protein [Candidatus Aenigmarchaeota archaeon]